jgi:hypothetical protein
MGEPGNGFPILHEKAMSNECRHLSAENRILCRNANYMQRSQKAQAEENPTLTGGYFRELVISAHCSGSEQIQSAGFACENTRF